MEVSRTVSLSLRDVKDFILSIISPGYFLSSHRDALNHILSCIDLKKKTYHIWPRNILSHLILPFCGEGRENRY